MAIKSKSKKGFQLRSSILRKALLQMIGLTAFAAILFSISAFSVSNIILKQRVMLQLSSVATAKKVLLEQRLQRDRELAAITSTRQSVQDIFASRFATSTLESLLVSLQEEGTPIIGITVLNRDGEVYATAGATIALQESKTTITSVRPVFEEEGWVGHVISSPIYNDSGRRKGTLAVRFSSIAFLHSLLDAGSIGRSAEVLLGTKDGTSLVLLNHQYSENQTSPLDLGDIVEQQRYGSAMADAILFKEGVRETEDYRGQNTFAAYRSLPTLGWGLVVKVNTAEAMQGVRVLAIAFAAIVVLVLLFAAVLARRMAMHLTGPILTLAKKMQRLGPGHWKLARSAKTGDEVELLERKAIDMAKRLRNVYDSLEDEIAARTKELQEEYIKGETILNTIDQGVMMVDLLGRITEANPAALNVLKCDGDSCKLRKVDEVLDVRLKQKQLTGAKHPVWQVLKKNVSVHSTPNLRFSIMRSDNIAIPVLMVVTPLMEDGKTTGAIVVFHDVTEERRVDYLKSEFISLASHQLRTPLSSLQWYVEIMAEEKGLSTAQREYIHEMEVATRRMSNLIDALLSTARLEGGEITPQKHTVNMTELVEDMGEELRALAKDKKIACKVSIPKQNIQLQTDSVLLHVVFKNLFSNAVKYTPSGGTVGVSLELSKGIVEIKVSDTGVGVPKKEMSRLFERLFRAENVRKLDCDGNGLGLYITKMIIDNLGGSIRVESKENKGTTFIVHLPVVDPRTKKLRKKPSQKKKK